MILKLILRKNDKMWTGFIRLSVSIGDVHFFSVVNMGFLNIRASARFPSGTLLYGFSLL